MAGVIELHQQAKKQWWQHFSYECTTIPGEKCMVSSDSVVSYKYRSGSLFEKRNLVRTWLVFQTLEHEFASTFYALTMYKIYPSIFTLSRAAHSSLSPLFDIVFRLSDHQFEPSEENIKRTMTYLLSNTTQLFDPVFWSFAPLLSNIFQTLNQSIGGMVTGQ